jgi:ABC-type transport system involved in cytochrome c biogenesis ATPase subunit
LQTGLVAVTGGERSGKTSYLRRLCGDLDPLPGEVEQLGAQAHAIWVDLSLPGQDDNTPTQWWATFQESSPHWNAALRLELAETLGLLPHVHKQLFMLSTGSRRKVAIVALLACGATITCLDQPFAALDGASIQVLRTFLGDMADHASRTWVVADYEADKRLPWAQVIALD